MSADLLRGINKMLAPLARQIRNSIARGVLTLIDDSTALQRVQVTLMALPQPDGSIGQEIASNLEVIRQYGFTSVPWPGAEAVHVGVGGVRAHGIVIAIDDRRYRLTGLAAGEVALYDDLGQKVHLTRSGIVISGADLPVTITNTPKVRVESALFQVTGDIIDHCDTQSNTVAEMRAIYNDHTHGGVQNGAGTTATPGATQ